MTERDDIAFGTPEAELLGAAAFDGEPLSPPAGVKAALMARVSQSGKALPGEASRDEGGSRGADEDEVSRGADVVELSRRRAWVRRLAGAAAAVFLAAGGFAAGRAWTMRGMSDETRFNALNQASDYSQTSHKMADGHTIRLVWSYKEHSAALVMPAGMRIPRGKAVQAWSVKGGRTTSMGMYPSGSRARYAFLSAMPDEGESVMLTMEPASGSSAPSSDMVADIPMGKK